MIRQEAQTDPGEVTGLLSICSIDAFILIGPCSTHSYVSIHFVQCINKEVDWLGSQLVVAMLVEVPFMA